MNDSVAERGFCNPEEDRSGLRGSATFALYLAVRAVELLLVDIFAIEECRVAWIGDAHFLEHLT